MTRILIADDHDVVRSGVRAILEGQAGGRWSGKRTARRPSTWPATRPDVVVLDYSLPLVNGIEATTIRARVPGAEVLIFTTTRRPWCGRC